MKKFEKFDIANDAKYIWEDHYPDGIDWRMDIPPMPLFTILDRSIEKFPNSTAIDFMDKTWTYRALGDLVDKAAKGLIDLGAKKGIKIGLFLPNSPFAIIFYYAILKTGATVVNYNPLYAKRELEHQVSDSDTDIMVTMNLNLMGDKTDHLLHNTRLNKVILCPMEWALPFPKSFLFPLLKRKDIFRPTIHAQDYIQFEDLIHNDGQFTPVEIDPLNDIAILQYTGGTTGVPKGAMLSHYNLYANTAQVCAWLNDATPGEDTMVGVLPFFHVFAMTAVLNMSVWYGMRILTVPKFELDALMKLVDKKKPTYLPAVPAIYNALANHKDIGKYDFTSIEFCLSGGAPLPAEVKKNFEERTGAKKVAEGYGLTECSPVATCNPIYGEIVTGSIGMPIPNTIIEITDRDDETKLMPQGEIGEVCIRGPQIMMGYYKNEDATEKTIRNGRLHTGDVGYIDERGYVYIVDRIKDLILVRGYNVYPRNIEEAIYLHPCVEECIVAGVPDKERGETVWAWVKPYEGQTVTAEDLDIFLKDKLSPIECPRKIIIRDKELPKTMVGKLSRKDLLEEEGIKRPLS